MQDIFTTYLYLFSSLLQADAAILGFGAIFVIYKLQSLDNRYQMAYDACQNAKGIIPEFSTKLMGGLSEDGIYDIISTTIHNPHIFKQMELLVTVPKRKEIVKNYVILPMFLIGFHCITTSILLWTAPVIVGTGIGTTLAVVVLIVFSVGIILSGRVGLYVIRTHDELSLVKYYPQIHERIEKLRATRIAPSIDIDISGDSAKRPRHKS
jgi:hypothetical protein